VPRLRILGAILVFPQYVFMAWFLVKHRENLPLFYFIIAVADTRQEVVDSNL
jgi:hypothetical protein